jgi:hypothetical protein
MKQWLKRVGRDVSLISPPLKYATLLLEGYQEIDETLCRSWFTKCGYL